MNLLSHGRCKMNENIEFNSHFRYIDDEFENERDFVRILQNE